MQAREFLELGVLRGAFAEHILRHCPTIARYYMLDPWRHLADWNKPANVDQSTFDEIYASAMRRTEFAGEEAVLSRQTPPPTDRTKYDVIRVRYSSDIRKQHFPQARSLASTGPPQGNESRLTKRLRMSPKAALQLNSNADGLGTRAAL